jgi:mycofactocin precursor
MLHPTGSSPADPLVEDVLDESLDGADPDTAPPLVEAELLVEDVSIDGMCGVY